MADLKQYMVIRNQQVAIEAESPDDAMKKVLAGEGTLAGTSINVSIRPQPVQQTRTGNA